MDSSAVLQMPYILASQAQKHVTHNEAIRTLDALVQLSVIDKDLTVPPASPTDGDRYIPATGSTGLWSGKDGLIAAFQDNGWIFYTPKIGFLAYLVDEALTYVFSASDWMPYSDGKIGGGTSILNASPFGAETRFELLEEELILSGPSIDSLIEIPDRAIVFSVSSRTTQAITGATSFDCGIAGDIGKFGSLLSIAVDATNSGVIGPTAYYANTKLRVTANGGNFTGGKIRLTIHYMMCSPATG